MKKAYLFEFKKEYLSDLRRDKILVIARNIKEACGKLDDKNYDNYSLLKSEGINILS